MPQWAAQAALRAPGWTSLPTSSLCSFMPGLGSGANQVVPTAQRSGTRQEVRKDTDSRIRVMESVATSQSRHWTETSHPPSRDTKQPGQTWKRTIPLPLLLQRFPQSSMVPACLLAAQDSRKMFVCRFFKATAQLSISRATQVEPLTASSANTAQRLPDCPQSWHPPKRSQVLFKILKMHTISCNIRFHSLRKVAVSGSLH